MEILFGARRGAIERNGDKEGINMLEYDLQPGHKKSNVQLNIYSYFFYNDSYNCS
jgi:hypothetical protein